MSLTTDVPPYILELQEQFSTIEDINDPTLMDNILSSLEKIHFQDEEFLEALLEKLPEMTVTWDQPWYQQSNCLTRPMKALGNDNSHDSENIYKSDTVCLKESNKIHKNWKKFVKIFDIPNMPECLARWRNKKGKHPNCAEERVRRFVIAFLAQGLKRTLYQVYKHVLIRYGTPVKGAYLKYEENIMDVCIHHCAQNCVPDLSALLGREPRGLYKRLLQKVNGTRERKKISWTLPLATKFLVSLMKHSDETLENLKNRKFEKSVWLKLEEEFEQNYVCLQLFWYRYLHVQLFVKYDIKIRKLRKHIFKRMKQYPYKVWGDIRWKELLTEYPDGFTHLFLYRTCFNLVKTYPSYRITPIEDVINYGLQKTKCIRNKRLKTLKLNEKQELEIVKYNNKLFK